MRRLAFALALAAALAVGGCCCGATGACVVESPWGDARCEPFVENPSCNEDDWAAPVAQLSVCGGTFHAGDDCSDLGFTALCEGGYWVRPRDGC